MNTGKYRTFWLLMLALVLLVCAYPIYMGVRVAAEMARSGAVPLENYPKYVIPYTPIAVALIVGVALLPLWQKLFRKWGLLPGALFSTAVFFAAERLMETKILVQTQQTRRSWLFQTLRAH